MRYRTPMVQARRRVARGLRVLRDALDEGPLIDGLVDVGRWLEEFHPRSLVELDYGGLVHAIARGGAGGGPLGRRRGRGPGGAARRGRRAAGEAYERLTERWRTVRELQFAS